MIKGWWSTLASTAILRVVTGTITLTESVETCLPTPLKSREAREQKYATNRYGTQTKLHVLTQPVNKPHKITCTPHALSRNTTHRLYYFMCM